MNSRQAVELSASKLRCSFFQCESCGEALCLAHNLRDVAVSFITSFRGYTGVVSFKRLNIVGVMSLNVH